MEKGQGKPKNPRNTNIWVGNLPPTIDKEELVAVFSRFGDIASARVFPPKSNGKYASAMMRMTAQDVATFIVEDLDGNLVDGLEFPIACNYATPQKEGGGGAPGGGGGPGPLPAGALGGAPRWSGGGALGPPSGFGKGGASGVLGRAVSAKGGGCKGVVGKGGRGDGGKGGWGDHGKSALKFGPPASMASKPAKVAKGPDGKNPPATNIWIGNLPADIDKETFVAVFAEYGEIQSARVFPPKKEGGHASAMARLATLEQATQIVETLDGQEIPGLEEPISCNYASPEKEAQFIADRSGARPAVAAISPRDDPPSYGKAGAGGWLRPKSDGGGGGGAASSAAPSHPYGGKGVIGAIGAIGSISPVVISGGKATPGSQPTATRAPPAAARKASGKTGGGGGKDGGKGSAVGTGTLGSMERLVTGAQASGLLGGIEVLQEAKLYIKNLPSDMDDLGLYRLFSPFGALAPGRVKAMLWPDKSCKGFGFVDFLDAGAAFEAREALNGFSAGGQKLIVEQAKTKEELAGGAQEPAGDVGVMDLLMEPAEDGEELVETADGWV